ncbi:MAG: helix-turn-helix transcriptional regulator [Methyloglobulus sp.]|nr:helix-turn-helix transcriptional regulator [Methyloglobulus sp.]
MNTIKSIPSVAKKIRYLRENNGFSTDDLATELKINSLDLEAIELGNKEADENLLERIALALRVPFSYLLEHRVQDNKSLNYLTRAIEKLSQNDHDELLQFAEFLRSVPKEK